MFKRSPLKQVKWNWAVDLAIFSLSNWLTLHITYFNIFCYFLLFFFFFSYSATWFNIITSGRNPLSRPTRDPINVVADVTTCWREKHEPLNPRQRKPQSFVSDLLITNISILIKREREREKREKNSCVWFFF